MIVSNVRNEEAAAAAAKFELPQGVVVGDDGNLVDNRSFYQTRWTGNETLVSLQTKYTEAREAEKARQKEDESYSWNPLVWVVDMFSAVFSAIGDGVKKVLGICGYGASEKADAAEGTEKAEGEKTEQA